jgi:hypothetical protein
MTSKESRTHVCKPGYWLKDISELGEAPNLVEVPQPPPTNTRLFGYEETEFLAKQYKPAHRKG